MVFMGLIASGQRCTKGTREYGNELSDANRWCKILEYMRK
jgi:hypothetical protein